MGAGPAESRSKKKSQANRNLEVFFKKGKKETRGFLTVYWLSEAERETQGRTSELYLGVAKRILALAVKRNRTKRLLREITKKWRKETGSRAGLFIRLTQVPAKLTTPIFEECLRPILEKIK